MTHLSTDIASWTATAVAELIRRQDPDGGWPYREGEPAGTEPTALAVLALSVAAPATEGLAPALAWLSTRQRGDGFFTASPVVPDASWLTPLAGLAVSRWGWSSAGEAAAQALISAEVFTYDGSPFPPELLAYDSAIPGWPWTIGGFSFVEPTSLAMIFLKRAGYGASERVRQGARFLRDRALDAGGWNYGEPKVLGADLFPAAVPGAMALLALADEQDYITAAGLNWLLAQRGQLSSLLSLNWATIALNVLGALDDDWRAGVTARWRELPADRRGPMETSLCLLGLAGADDHPLAVS